MIFYDKMEKTLKKLKNGKKTYSKNKMNMIRFIRKIKTININKSKILNNF